jgi:hypothetical protein
MEMGLPVIRVDFNNADASGRVRLTTVAARADIAALTEPLSEGMRLQLVDDELSAVGTAAFNSDEDLWTAVVDWDEVAASAG